MTPDLKTLLKGNTVQFSRYSKGYLYYRIRELITEGGRETPPWEFPVPIEDCGDATFPTTEKAIMFMRYIRRAQEEGSFTRVAP